MSDPQFQVDGAGKGRLSGSLTFASVPALTPLGRQLLEGVDLAVLDLAGIKHSDSAGLALLVSWLRLAHQQNKRIIFQNTPEQLVGLAVVSGVADILSLTSSNAPNSAPQ